ncbi:MAG: TDP-N-acetylfucosamine:lipid II N-acetylfucosaminyltransferase [Culturomica sp.]|jgi:hypothetical protein|nr:TDP-N-acetylfucosamine:lipid II N-acetylfucosaminyltransferase [Culturomica sp.]
MKKAAHICVDEKFIDIAIDMFSQISEFASSFYCLHKNQAPIQYIKQADKLIVVRSERELIHLINADCDIVFLHGLHLKPYYISFFAPKVKIVWLSWGYDLYSDNSVCFTQRMPLHINMYAPLTRKYVYKNKMHVVKKIIKKLFLTYFYNRMLRRVNYMSTVLPVEYDLIKLFNKNIKIKYFPFCYLSKDDVMGQVSGSNILLGNSATIANNHIDVIKQLEDIELKDRTVVLPLSYGSLSYRDFLLKNYLLSNSEVNFQPITDFIQFRAYCDLLNSCGYAIFGHKRQQAVGNVNLMLRKGAKVFLYQDSIVYQQLLRDGYKVFTIEHDLNEKELSSLLPESEQKRNQQIFEKKYNYNNYIVELNHACKVLSV